MLQSQKLALEASETRQKLNGLLAKDKLSETERSEMDTLSKRMGEIESEYRAAVTAESDIAGSGGPAPDSEDRERSELRSKIRLGRYLLTAMRGGNIDGAEAEYNASREMRSEDFPLELLAPLPAPETRSETRESEDRATVALTVTPNVMPRRWLDRLFAQTAAQAIGITMESVAPGVASYPITTAGASAAQRGRTQAAADATWTIAASELRPTRNAVRAVFSIEDDSRIPGLEESIRRDLAMALTEGIDRAMFVGEAGANEDNGDITGLTTATGVTEKEITQANKTAGASVIQAFAELIDGIHATMPSDLRTVMAVPAGQLWQYTPANTGTTVDTLIGEYLRRFGLQWRIRDGIATDTAANSFGAIVGLARGLEGAAVCPVWESGTLIRDPYSRAAQGEVALTLSYMWNFGLIRASNFARVKFVANPS